MAHRDGLITNDKFCLSRFGKLKLRYWHRPLRLRSGTLLEVEQHPGGRHDTGMDDPQTHNSTERWAAEVGSGLPVPSEMERGDDPILGTSGGKP